MPPATFLAEEYFATLASRCGRGKALNVYTIQYNIRIMLIAHFSSIQLGFLDQQAIVRPVIK